MKNTKESVRRKNYAVPTMVVVYLKSQEKLLQSSDGKDPLTCDGCSFQ